MFGYILIGLISFIYLSVSVSQIESYDAVNKCRDICDYSPNLLYNSCVSGCKNIQDKDLNSMINGCRDICDTLPEFTRKNCVKLCRAIGKSKLQEREK